MVNECERCFKSPCVCERYTNFAIDDIKKLRGELAATMAERDAYRAELEQLKGERA